MSPQRLFHETAYQANHSGWAVAVNGVMWRTPDTPDNSATFAKPGTPHGETAYLQARMLCQMELTNHLLKQAVMESCAINEMLLVEKLIERTPDHTLTLFVARPAPCLANYRQRATLATAIAGKSSWAIGR